LPNTGEEQRVTSALEDIFNLYNAQIYVNQMNQHSSSIPRNIRYQKLNIIARLIFFYVLNNNKRNSRSVLLRTLEENDDSQI
jgi:hypothetical protein